VGEKYYFLADQYSDFKCMYFNSSWYLIR